MIVSLSGSGGKMSKSDPNSCIFLSDSEQDIRKKINKAYLSMDDEKSCLFFILKYCVPYIIIDSKKMMYTEIMELHKNKSLNLGEFKKAIADSLISIIK